MSMKWLPLLIAPALLAFACGGDGSSSTPSPTPTSTGLAPLPTPTATPMSTLESSDKGQLSRLLFFSAFHPEPSLYTVTADASDLTLIGTVEEIGAIPSPDGEKIVVECRPSENGTSQTAELCLSTKDGFEARIQIGGLIQAIAWAPDSRRLLFVTNLRENGTQLGSELYIVDATNGSVRSLITDTPAVAFRKPRWSPDGRRVALLADYSLRTSPPQRTDLEVVNVQDGGRIILGGASDFAWAPDSSSLAFIGGRELYRVAFDGSNLRQLTDGGETGFDVWSGGGPPVWSPDGRWIAVSVLQPDRASRIFIASAQRRQGQLLAPDLPRSTSPVWSLDSDRLAFVGTGEGGDPVCGGVSALYVADLENRTPQQLTMSRPFTFFPLVTWSPDGDRLFYTTWSGLQGDDHASLAKLLPCIEGGPEPSLFSVTADGSGSPVQLTDFGVDMFLGWQPQP